MKVGYILERLPIWFNGPQIRNTVSDVNPCASAKFSASAKIVSWLIITPLETPVVPVVKRISATSLIIKGPCLEIRDSNSPIFSLGRDFSNGTAIAPI